MKEDEIINEKKRKPETKEERKKNRVFSQHSFLVKKINEKIIYDNR
jgi:hypothetical protein